jgi:polyphosphate kinase
VARYADDLAEELEDLAHDGEPAARRADRFFDREASWLDYNSRLLELAADEGLPLLDRVRFTAIFAGNLDEFFMVRVAGLRRRLATGIAVATPNGMAPREQLDLVSRRAHELVAEHSRVFLDDLLPRLQEHGICLLHHGRSRDLVVSANRVCYDAMARHDRRVCS